MANAADKNAVIWENLTDAGLSRESVERCMELIDTKSYTALERYLAVYRNKLLDRIHEYTARLDCLDYFTYDLKKNGGI